MGGFVKSTAISMEALVGNRAKLLWIEYFAPELIDALLDDVKQEVETVGNAGTPFDTGNLVSRNEVNVAYFGGTIQLDFLNDCEYASFVLDGHTTRSGSWVAPQDWVSPALLAGERVLMRGFASLSWSQALLG